MEKTMSLKSINGLNFFGSSFDDFLKPSRTKEKIECWVKIYSMIFYFYNNPKNKNNTFFVSTSNIWKKLNNLGNHYHYKTVQKEIRKLEMDNLITVRRTAMYDLKTNEYKGIKREIFLDMKKAKEFFSVLDEDDPIIKELPDKHRFKKVIRKRPFVLETALPKALEKAKELGKVFSDTKELLAYYVYKVSNRYLYTDKFFSGYVPSFLKNELDDVNDSFVKNTKIDTNTNLLSEKELTHLEKLYKDRPKEYIKKVKKLINCEIDNNHKDRLEALYIYTSHSKIIGYADLNGELHGKIEELRDGLENAYGTIYTYEIVDSLKDKKLVDTLRKEHNTTYNNGGFRSY